MSKLKEIKLPSPSIPKTLPSQLPFNGSAITEKKFSFSFSCFDRSHELFNLGDNSRDGVISGHWFIDLLDCFKSVNNKTVSELKQSIHDLHPIDWAHTNTAPPSMSNQHEYWQFRINKSKGRVIGILIENVFYIVWLDPHHNLTDSEGYGKARYYPVAQSIYEMQEDIISKLQEEKQKLEQEIDNLLI